MGRMYVAFILLSYTFMCNVMTNASPNFIDTKRIIFAVDTSTLMGQQNANYQIKQAIMMWIKYLAPKDMFIGIVQLKHNDSGLLINLDSNSSLVELEEMLPDVGYGQQCLECGLQHASELFETCNENDLITLLMGEYQIYDIHNTPVTFKSWFKTKKVRIFTIALTERADDNMEQLASETNGMSDYVSKISVARLLLSFFSIPISKDYLIIATSECEAACNFNFWIMESRPANSSVQVFVCPRTDLKDEARLYLNEEMMILNWDNYTKCFFYETKDPQIGEWRLKQDAFKVQTSIIVILKHSINYPTISCRTNVGVQAHDAQLNDILIHSDVENDDGELEISAFVDSGNDDEALTKLSRVNNSFYSACLRPTKKIGRHIISCRSYYKNVTLLTSQAQSFKLSRWPYIWPVDNSVCHITSKNNTTDIPSMNENGEDKPQITTPLSTMKNEKIFPEEVSERTLTDRDKTTMVFTGNNTEGESNATSVDTTHTKSARDSFEKEINFSEVQIIIFVVGSIILVEAVIIVYTCKAKKVHSDQEKNKLMKHTTINYEDNFEIHFNSAQYKDQEDI